MKARKRVKKTVEDGRQEQDSTSSDDDFFESTVKYLYVKKVATGKAESKTIPVTIDDVETWAEPDSGADVNLMDSHQCKVFLHRTR